MLTGQHPVFREVDAGFHAYLEVITAMPEWNDNQIEQALAQRGVEAGLARGEKGIGGEKGR